MNFRMHDLNMNY